MTIITKDNFKTEIEEYEGLAVIDLYADWCGPCRMLAPTLADLEREMPDVKFCKINVDNEPELAELFKVTSIPMIAVVKDGVFVDFVVGYQPKENIKKFIETSILN